MSHSPATPDIKTSITNPEYDALWLQYETSLLDFSYDLQYIMETIEGKAIDEANAYQLFRAQHAWLKLNYHTLKKWSIKEAVLYLAAAKDGRDSNLLKQENATAYTCLYNYLIGTFITQYGRSNYNNTATGDRDLNNIEQWSLQDIRNVSNEYFQACFDSLPHTLPLKTEDFAFMLNPEPQFRNLRPSMYDLLLQDRIINQTLTGDRKACLALIDSAITMHSMPDDRDLLLDYEILRLVYIDITLSPKYDTCFYWQQLNKLEQKYGPDEAIDYARGVALFSLSKLTSEVENDLVTALSFFNNIIEHGSSPYLINNAKYYREQILKKFLQIEKHHKDFAPAAKLQIPVTYANIDTLRVRIYAVHRNNPPDLYYKKDTQTHQYYVNTRNGLSKLKTCIREQTFVLKSPAAHHAYSTELWIDSLPIGQYALLFYSDPACDSSTILASERIQVTNIHVSMENSDRQQRVVVRDRTSGVPLVHKRVICHNFLIRHTNVNGEVRFRNLPSSLFQSITVHNGKDHYETTDRSLYHLDYRWDYHHQRMRRYRYSYRRAGATAQIITDRTLYRPGQTLYFKFIASHRGKAIANKELTLTLNNPGAQYYDTLSVTTNEFGSASGSFRLPHHLGSYYIDLDDFRIDARMNSCIRVEEYKLPTFKVTLDKDSSASVIGDTITISGSALALNGTPIGNADVHLVIVPPDRKALFTTDLSCDEKGHFTYRYGTNASDTNLFLYSYHITAAVTDLNGETHSSGTYITLTKSPFNITVREVTDIDLSQTDTVQWLIMPRNKSGVLVSTPMHIKVELLEESNSQLKPLTIPGGKSKQLLYSKEEYAKYFPAYTLGPFTWTKPVRSTVLETVKVCNPDSLVQFNVSQWPTGTLRLTVSGISAKGDTITQKQTFKAVRSSSDTLTVEEPIWAKITRLPTESGGNAQFSVASNLTNATVICDIFQDGKHLTTKRVQLNRSQKSFEFDTKANLGNQLSLITSIVQNDQFYSKTETQYFATPVHLSTRQIKRINKTYRDLSLKLTHWNKVLEPGSPEQWELEVSDILLDSKPKTELLAWMVDCSLYELSMEYENFKYLPFGPRTKHIFRSNNRYFGKYPKIFYLSEDNHPIGRPFTKAFELQSKEYETIFWITWPILSNQDYPVAMYEHLPFEMDNTTSTRSRVSGENLRTTPARSVSAAMEGVSSIDGTVTSVRGNRSDGAKTVIDGVITSPMVQEEITIAQDAQEKAQPSDLPTDAAFTGFSKDIRLRSNFQETAFFMPDLRTDEQGRVKIAFTLPDQYTKWHLNVIGHTQNMKVGTLSEYVVSRKSLMLQTNAPRFFREGDTMTFRIKISMLKDSTLNGHAVIRFFDFATGDPIPALLTPSDSLQTFRCPGKQSTSVGWNIVVPRNVEAIGYRVLAQAGNYGDGEENAIPVLPNRALLTESMHFVVRSSTDTTIEFKSLNNNKSATLANYSLSLEANTNPVWSAIRSLPYLMQYRYDCNEQTFSKLYANAIALHLVKQHPEIETMFELWRNDSTQQALQSPLLQNDRLRNTILEETPWVMSAQRESQQRTEMAKNFSREQLEKQIQQQFNKLSRNQNIAGGWGWFGSRDCNSYITNHIVAGFQKLKHLGIELPETRQMIAKAIRQMDSAQVRIFRNAIKEKTERSFTHTDAQYLYARSYGDIDTQWLQQPYVQQLITLATRDILKADITRQAETALMLHRIGRNEEAQRIIRFLRMKATVSKDDGMYWGNPGQLNRAQPRYYAWHEAPIERQALLIEAFTEIDPKPEELEAMQHWLLTQKQSNCWSNTKATAEAIFALLLNTGPNILSASTTTVQVAGEELPTTSETNASTIPGHVERVWQGDEIVPELARIQVATDSVHPLFGAYHWQYFEDLDKVENASAGLHLERALFHKVSDENGVQLDSVTAANPVRLGETVTVRIVISTDRDLEYVHLKDQRASSFEPTSSKERYGYQNGLSYFESPRDAAINFFITQLNKGTYVLEYELFATQTGDFSNGIATIECMYAPEYRAQSNGGRVIVK